MNRTVLVMTVMLIVSISTMGVAGAETNGIHNENVTDNLIIRIVKPILNVTVEPLVVVKGCTLRIWGDTTLDRDVVKLVGVTAYGLKYTCYQKC